MKTKDKVIIQQGLGEVTEVHENGFCTVTMPNGEGYRMYLYECMMHEEYHEIKPLNVRLYNFYRWLFSKSFDAFLTKLFFKAAKFIFIFGLALLVSLPFILLL